MAMRAPRVPSPLEERAERVLPAEIRRLESGSRGVVPARGLAAAADAAAAHNLIGDGRAAFDAAAPAAPAQHLIGANLKETLNAAQEVADARAAQAAKNAQNGAQDQWAQQIQAMINQEMAAAGEQDATLALAQEMDIGQAAQRELQQNAPQAIAQVQRDVQNLRNHQQVGGNPLGFSPDVSADGAALRKVLVGGASIAELVNLRAELVGNGRLR